MLGRKRVRTVLAAVVVLSLAGAALGSVDGMQQEMFEKHLNESGVAAEGAQVAPPADGVTVIATDSNSWRGETADGPRGRAELVALNPNGTVLYYDDRHTRYWDVDPVPNTSRTVEFSFADHVTGEHCPDEWSVSRYRVSQERWDTYYEAQADVDACTRNGVERVNLSTGERTVVWSQFTPGKEATRFHDVDRLGPHRLLVADIYFDRVFVVDTRTDEIEWSWNASERFATDTGGPYPSDWTHINDVEALPDGRITVSARNHDQVIFLDPNGSSGEWTLGTDDDHGTLYEQHNPDYLPESNGGPAVLVGDSENNRVVEYERASGEWRRTWIWRDARMQWPRDADRLPNGHTLITDSNGNRVLEVNERGDVVWSLNVGFPYEAERLGTGDESAGGPSARQAGLESHTPGGFGRVVVGLKSAIPGKYLNGLLYATPPWLGVPELFCVLVALLGTFVWAGAELRWRLGDRVSESRTDTSG